MPKPKAKLPFGFMKNESKKIIEAVKLLGSRLFDMEGFLLTIAQTQATQFKLMNARITSLTPAEVELLKDAASKCESSLERQEFLASQFRNTFDKLLQS